MHLDDVLTELVEHSSCGPRSGRSANGSARELRSSGPLGACQADWHRWPLPPGAADHARFGAALRLPRQQHSEAAGRVGAVGAAVAGRRTRQPRRPAHLETTQSPSADRLHARGRAADQLPHRPRLPGRREDLGRRHRRAQRVRRRLQRRVHQLRHYRSRREQGVRLRPVARPDAGVVQPVLPGHRPARPGHGDGSRGLDVRDHLRTQMRAHARSPPATRPWSRRSTGCRPAPRPTVVPARPALPGPTRFSSLTLRGRRSWSPSSSAVIRPSVMATCRPPARAALCRSSGSY